MRKRGVYLIVAILVVAGVLVAVFNREREPEYGGKRLSEWVEQYADHSDSLGQKAEAADAIRHIGTNAVPYLIEWLQYETPPWKRRLRRQANWVIWHLNPSRRLVDEKDYYR